MAEETVNINGLNVDKSNIPEAYQYAFQPKKKEEIKLTTEEPSSANGFGVYTQLQNLQTLAGSKPKLVTRTDVTASQPVTPVTKTGTFVGAPGVTVDSSGKIASGNYLILSGLNASQRRMARKNGFRYTGRNGEVYTVGPGTSRAEMRRIVNQYNRDMDEYRKLRSLGLIDKANDVYETAANNPNSQYVRYDAETAAPEQKPGQASQASQGVINYTYDFGSGLNADNGLGNLYIQMAKGMGADKWKEYANNGVINRDSMVKYIRDNGISDFDGTTFTDDNMRTLNQKLGTNYTWTADPNASKPATAPTSALSQDTINLLKNLLSNPEIQKLVGSKKQGGKMNKFQYGGAVNQQQVAQEQAQAQQKQLTEIFQAIAENPQETLMALQKQGIQPKQIIDLAQKMAKENPSAQAALQAISQMGQMAKEGAKLQYIKRLRGECPEGYELKMFKVGGKICNKCEKIKEEKKGGEVKGDESDLVKEFKSKRCGGKMKKEEGGEISKQCGGGKTKKK